MLKIGRIIAETTFITAVAVVEFFPKPVEELYDGFFVAPKVDVSANIQQLEDRIDFLRDSLNTQAQSMDKEFSRDLTVAGNAKVLIGEEDMKEFCANLFPENSEIVANDISNFVSDEGTEFEFGFIRGSIKELRSTEKSSAPVSELMDHVGKDLLLEAKNTYESPSLDVISKCTSLAASRLVALSNLTHLFRKFENDLEREITAVNNEADSGARFLHRKLFDALTKGTLILGGMVASFRIFSQLPAVLPKRPFFSKYMLVFPITSWLLYEVSSFCFEGMPNTATLAGDWGRISDQLIAMDNDIVLPPVVWPGATREDPFTWSRLLNSLMLQPVLNEVMFRGVLFARLLSIGGVIPAFLLTSLSYAVKTGIDDEDNHLALLGLDEGSMLGFAFCKSLVLQCLYFGSGRLIFPILASIAMTGTSIGTEFYTRNDIITEELQVYKDLVSFLGYLNSKYWLHFMPASPNQTFLGDEKFRNLVKMIVKENENFGEKSASSLANKIVLSPIATASVLLQLHDLTDGPNNVSNSMSLTDPRKKSLFMPFRPDQQANIDAMRQSKEGPLKIVMSKETVEVYRLSLFFQTVENLYPNGMTIEQLERHLSWLLTTKGVSLDSLVNMMKEVNDSWNKVTEDRRLDIIDGYFKYKKQFLDIEASRYDNYRSLLFMNRLGGKSEISPADEAAYAAELNRWMKNAWMKSNLCTCRQFGWTPQKLHFLAHSKETKSSPEMVKLWNDWDVYLRTTHKNKIMEKYGLKNVKKY